MPGGEIVSLPHTVLEGHRLALCPVEVGAPLLSWGLPFGLARVPIAPGDYLCNDAILRALAVRRVPFELPGHSNYSDLAAGGFSGDLEIREGEQVGLVPVPGTFEGFERPGGRGVGTRNHVAILATSSRTAALAQELARGFEGVRLPGFDGVVAVTHTEGGESGTPNNLEVTLRTLAGFFTHPNLGAIVAIDSGGEAVGNRALADWMERHGRPWRAIPQLLVSAGAVPSVEALLRLVANQVQGWLPMVASVPRRSVPLSGLAVGLQCGGSDAFSGVSGNPLVGWVARELIRHGGRAGLAETDELVGAEPYLLANVRDRTVAEAFLSRLERFQAWAGWHGHGAQNNPSGGNLYRGLYNITIKSIGAGRKKAPDVRLDRVIDFGEPMDQPGFTFMDSPGNDLESIAGQVASGCNLILFSTGNGSITNFPFVPTLKVMTNTPRHELLGREMDFNAGRYLDGVPMDLLGREAFELALRVAGGERTAGERAGHAQVQLWREWRQTDGSRLPGLLARAEPDGEPLMGVGAAGSAACDLPELRFRGWRGEGGGLATDRVALVVPTSLCAGQVGVAIARSMASSGRRVCALPHTEGCGVSGGDGERILMRTLLGYLLHPSVDGAVLLEHGCEKTHHDAVREVLIGAGVDPLRFGWASIQLDGGLELVSRKVMDWFAARPRDLGGRDEEGGESDVCLGWMTDPGVKMSDGIVDGLKRWMGRVVSRGGSVVLPWVDGDEGREVLGWVRPASPTLSHGERVGRRGLHWMEMPTGDPVEMMTGLGAGGVQAVVRFSASPVLQAHPFVPVLLVGEGSGELADLGLESGLEGRTFMEVFVERLGEVLSGGYEPRLMVAGRVAFQVTRGWLGVSL